ncbi:MAG TPA: ABC transporter permease [Casimicrobiaceae bacterium]|jgi:phospholipid/cholesterol/gamma-HCH transport system permease protein|nr:ABC transporter permease [Casimicrobiaceae bacterium]
MPTPRPEAPAASALTVAVGEEGNRAALHGVLDIRTLGEAERALSDWLKKRKRGALDLSDLKGLDTPGALFLCGLRNQGVELTGVSHDQQALLDLIFGLELKPLPKPPTVPRWREVFIELGKGADAAGRDTLDIITFVGRAASGIGQALLHPSRLRLPSISRHVRDTGIHALPIISLMAIMISIVIGYQSVAQLRPYGGEDFMINLVAVSMLREMGVLITAIMVAGRSGAAFAAEIGVMKARDEVDALKVMGLDPLEMLVVPRLIGLVITLPLLTFMSDIMGLLGGALVSRFLLDISPLQYLDRVRHAVDANDLLVGLIKAPIFGFLIGIIGCMHGLRVSGSAESVGAETTRAVVKAIFVVIVLDALFSILFEKLRI